MIKARHAEHSRQTGVMNGVTSRRPSREFASALQHPLDYSRMLQQTLGNQGVLGRLQAKLAINPPGDAGEWEADRVALAVLSSPNATPVEPVATVHGKTPAAVQRKCAGCAEEDEKLRVQRKDSSPIQAAAVPPVVGDVLNSPGQPLDRDTRWFMESRFGHDFSDVRIHTNGAAAESATAIHAKAYTVGSDVVFAEGQYATHAREGQELLAHELAHVVQQRATDGLVQEHAISHPSDSSERAADAAAAAVVANQQVPPQSSVSAPLVARQHTCHTGHALGQGELVPEGEKRGNTELYYRIWGTWKKSDYSLNTFAERVVNAWIPRRFGPLAPEDRTKVSDFLFTTALGKLGAGAGEDGCDYAIALSKATLAKATELSGEVKRAIELQHAREELVDKPGQTVDYAHANVNQRLVLLEDRVRVYWTGNKDEQAILDIVRTTPDDQAAELSRRLSTDRYGDETFLAALDRVVDLGNNLDLHTELTKLHLRGLGGEKGVKAILEGAPVLPWHDVMGFGHDVPATFSVTPGAGGKIVIKYHRGNTLADTDMPYQGELDALPPEMKIGGHAFDPDQLFKVHDWDEGKFVVVRARDLLAYQNIGIRNWLGNMAMVASFAIPGGAATTTAGKVALFAIERAIPLLIAAVRENRLSLVQWFPTWGPRMIYFADVAELAIGLYGVANFARSGVKFFNAWREARFARKLWEAGATIDDAEKAAVRIENEADKVLKAADEFREAESLAGKGRTADPTTALDVPGGPGTAKGGAADVHAGGPGATPHVTPSEEKVLASEPVKGGHHIDVTDAGIELCSPKPCPLLRVEYATELDRNPALGKEMDVLDALRKSDPAAAAKKGADLRETLAYTRAHTRLFQGLQKHATPAQEARLAKLLDSAEDAGIHVGERQFDEISKRLSATRSTGQIDQELAALEQDLDRATSVKGEIDDAGKLGGGSRAGDPSQQLPEGTQASGTTTKPRTVTLTDPELLAAELTKRVGARPPGHEAHHIVPKGMKEAEEARAILRDAGIGINEAENGIWLPKDSSLANEFTGDIHSKVHTARAIRLITDQLREGAKDGPAGVRRALRTIQRTLSDLKFER